MKDAPASDPSSRRRLAAATTVGPFKKVLRILAAVLIVSVCWAAVNETTAEKKCDTKLRRLSVYLKQLDSYFSNCQCMKHSLDLSDRCSTMYLPPLP
jgi:hypothetical protein